MDEKNHEEGIELKINFFDQPIMVRIGDNDFRYGLGNQQLNIELWSTNCNIQDVNFENPFKEGEQ